MIDLFNVSKTFRVKGTKKIIFDGLTFSFPHDRNVAIMGPNGAGKSTLMRLIAGSEPPDRGRVVRHGKVSWPLGFSGGFNGSMSGIENIRFVARVYGQNTEAVIDYVREFSELGASLKFPVRTYSSGMKARLAFGMSLALDFDCYLIDEVTAVGDERFKVKSKKAFQEKLPSSRVIMISHSMSQIKEYCQCGIILTGNHIEFHETIDDLSARYRELMS